MAYALVGSAGAINNNAGSTGTASFGQATTAGNLLIAWMSSAANSATNPFSTSSSGWTLIAAVGKAFNWSAAYYKKNCGAGETAPSWSTSNVNGNWWIQLAEFSGGDTAAPLDQSGTIDDGGMSGPFTAVNGAVDATAGDLIISSWGADGSGTNGQTVTASMTDSNNNAVTTHLSTTSNGDQYCGFVWGIAGTPLGTHADTAQTYNGVAFQRSDTVIASFKPASGGAAPSGTVQPQATVPVRRRKPARAAWAQITGQAFVAVPAPRQEYQLLPRRRLARGQWRGITGQAFVAVPAPAQQSRTWPRRKPARVYIQFTPVTTTNAAAAPGVAGSVPVLMANQTRVMVRRDGRIVRR